MARLRATLPDVAAQTVAAVVAEVPAYASAMDGPIGTPLTGAVQMALREFLKLAARSRESDPSSPLQPGLDAAYALGRGEAREGRTMDALLAAYRVGARVAWRELAAAVSADVSGTTMAQFAELVFAYIDGLSAASVSGHADELASTDRARQRNLDRLTLGLLAGEHADVLRASAQRADWAPPDTLTAVLLPAARLRGAAARVDGRSLLLSDDLPGLETDQDIAVLLVPDVGGPPRGRLLTALAGRQAVVGPARPWLRAQLSYDRALRAHALGLDAPNDTSVDTEQHLVDLVIGADADALADLRARVLAPLADLRASAVEKLTETWRALLMYQGRRDDVAAALFVHPQTVRYRVGQLREVYGDRFDDPEVQLSAMIALS